jgi:kanamycin kinase
VTAVLQAGIPDAETTARARRPANQPERVRGPSRSEGEESPWAVSRSADLRCRHDGLTRSGAPAASCPDPTGSRTGGASAHRRRHHTVAHLGLSHGCRPGITAAPAMTAPQLAAPMPLAAAYAEWVWTPVSCYPAQTTWRLDHRGGRILYAKVGRTGAYPGLAAEAARTRWARPYLPVPGVVATGTDGALEWLVTTGLPGLPATDTTLGEPANIVVVLAGGLRRLDDRAPAQQCPFQFRLPVALDHVRRRAAAGHVDPAEDFDDDHGHLDLDTALRELERLRPNDEDPVVCHGDYCPPNALLTDGQVTGYVDLGELGVADRWWDLAVATRAVTGNYGPGLEGLFLDAYGARPDPRRQAFYRLLYDLAS